MVALRTAVPAAAAHWGEERNEEACSMGLELEDCCPERAALECEETWRSLAEDGVEI